VAKTIGVVLSERVIAGLVIDHQFEGELHSFPESEDDESALVELPTEVLVKTLADLILRVRAKHPDVTAVGVAMPGLIRDGVVEDSPNIPQLKGARIGERLANELHESGFNPSVFVLNDADGMAAGLAAASGKLDHFVRVWTLGIGIGYGRYPFAEGVWEGGHTCVTLDDKENCCGCGGKGHIEGIMGHRAMRLRFLDLEPEEVFEEARKGDHRCLEFVKLWHKALAAGCANSIHMSGAGKFFFTGFNARFIDMPMLKNYMQEMVKMSPLLSYSLEIVQDNPKTRVVGAAVAAEQAATR